MSYATHCDTCGSWQKETSEFPPFLELWEGADLVGHFCSLDCAMKFCAANSEPTEVVEP